MSGTDTLVFYLCEHDVDLNLSDMQLFVLYDFASSQYAIYGYRKPSKGQKKDLYTPFYFMANKAKDVAKFVSTVIEKNNYFTYAMYSFNELPNTVGEIDFKLLHKYMKNTRELSAFDNMEFSQDRVRDMVSLTKRIISVYDVYQNEDYEV